MSGDPSIVVVGGGHAGVEAALAAGRVGASVILITMDTNSIGRMSCNPAIGGLGKGHLVQEIDSLGGVMSRAADHSGIQFKILNTSKGRAVWSLRAQVDKLEYPKYIQSVIKLCENIKILRGEVVDFNVDKGRLTSVVLDSNDIISASAMIVCSGTFLNGLIHIGGDSYSAGRYGERPSFCLSQVIKNIGFKTSRLKTGTPPRILSTSIDWDRCNQHQGDIFPTPFSIYTGRPFVCENVPCHSVDTNVNVHDILSCNLNKSAMYSGKINAVGPRYCPSIEDKVVRFSEREKHQLFLEPEWLGSSQIYVNGFSTSMPKRIQEQALNEIPALRSVSLIRPGYAIEYDYFPTNQLKSTLESKNIEGLYFAGQLNGTSGYEEAAAQGLVAGANAALKLFNRPPFVLRRDEAYIGVLIDDLITKDIDEPYRMFTSSAEHRLSLRGDSAAFRLTEKGFQFGLVSDHQRQLFLDHKESVNTIKYNCNNLYTMINDKSISITEYIRRPENSIRDAVAAPCFFGGHGESAIFTAETDIKYEGYVKIETARVKKIRKLENIPIPFGFNYNKIQGLSNESREKLTRVRPETLGQASRLAGVRPSDLGVLAICLQQYT